MTKYLPRTLFQVIVPVTAIIWSVTTPTAPAKANLLYSISDSGKLLEYNPTTSEIKTLSEIPGYNSSILAEPNGLAYDNGKNNLIYADQFGKLWSWNDRSTFVDLNFSVGVAPTCGGSNANPCASNAAYYDDAYWYFSNQTNTLNKISLSRNVAGGFTGVSSTTSFTITDAVYQDGVNAGQGLRYGDIAINTENGLLYGVTNTFGPSSSVFYTLDLTTLTSPDTLASKIFGGTQASNVQIAFNTSNTVLYAADTNGQFYTVNTSTGVLSAPIADFGTANGSRDLAGAAFSTVPGPLPIFGAAIAFERSRKLRRKMNSRKSA